MFRTSRLRSFTSLERDPIWAKRRSAHAGVSGSGSTDDA